MWYVTFIPPFLVAVGTALGFIIWRAAQLRSDEFSLPDKFLVELSADDLRPMVDLMTSRLAWFTTALVFFLSSLFGIGISIFVIIRMRSDSSGRLFIIGSSSVTTLVILAFWMWRKGKNLAPPFLDELMKQTSGKIIPAWLIAFFNGLAFVAVAFIVGGSCSVLASAGRSAEAVNSQFRNLGMLLFAGAVFLVACVLEINQLHRWSGAILGEDVRREVNRAAAVMAGAVGLLFSFMLAATYVPTFIVLQYRASDVNQSVGSSLNNALNIVVILSPLLVGLVSNVWSSSSWSPPKP